MKFAYISLQLEKKYLGTGNTLRNRAKKLYNFSWTNSKNTPAAFLDSLGWSLILSSDQVLYMDKERKHNSMRNLKQQHPLEISILSVLSQWRGCQASWILIHLVMCKLALLKRWKVDRHKHVMKD